MSASLPAANKGPGSITRPMVGAYGNSSSLGGDASGMRELPFIRGHLTASSYRVPAKKNQTFSPVRGGTSIRLMRLMFRD